MDSFRELPPRESEAPDSIQEHGGVYVRSYLGQLVVE